MRIAMYMRIGNPDQVSAQHPEGELTGQRRSVGRDRSRVGVCAGNNIPSLQEFLQEINRDYLQAFQLDNNSPSILPQLSNNPPYSQRSYAGFSDFHSKKAKTVCWDKIEKVFVLMSTYQHISVKQNTYCALIRYFCLESIILTIQKY